jgi:hypothetical protein
MATMATTTNTAAALLDRDLFVQAFWAKCREVIRPELDRAVERLRARDVETEIASQEFDATSAKASESGPSLTLTARNGARLAFYGDVARQRMLVYAGRLKTATAYTLDQLDEPEAASVVRAWEATLESSNRASAPSNPAPRLTRGP